MGVYVLGIIDQKTYLKMYGGFSSLNPPGSTYGPWYWRMLELLAFECKTSVDKRNKFRKIKTMQHVLVVLQ